MKKVKYILLIIFVFILSAFNFRDKLVSGWYLQTIQGIGSREISDVAFTDSLTGYAVANLSADSVYILKSSNGGDNWQIIYRQYYAMTRINFINSNTGFICGGYFYKSTNGGYNWNQLNMPAISAENMYVISTDTIWLLDTDPLVGGLFRTTNGGTNWEKRDNGILQPFPDKLYFYNSRIGFASGGSRLFRTTNSGYNWEQVTNNNGFNDMVFYDSLIGYKTYDSIRKTSDGGINWIAQKKPVLNYENGFYKFAMINKDTIWGVGGIIYTSIGARGIIYKTTNGGINWGYQIPDTVINIFLYNKIFFFNAKNGWAYGPTKGIHTTTGGDTTFYVGINNQSEIVPKDFVLYQNYPNPFNPVTSIKYNVESTKQIKIVVFDILGKEATTLVNEKKKAGEYEVSFNALSLSSGIYYYVLYADGVRMAAKKMVLIK